MTETVAVVGGTGTLGALVVAELVDRGATVRVLSRNAAAVPTGAEHRRVDLTNGEGLAGALAGATVVVDAANSNRGAEQTLVAGTGRLLDAGAAAGVGHHLAISIVGIDLVPVSYYPTSSPRSGRSKRGRCPGRSSAPPSSTSCSTEPSPRSPASGCARPAPPSCSRSIPAPSPPASPARPSARPRAASLTSAVPRSPPCRR
jgi:nucleoside-diphosphate-sugar epimerase